jgi:dTDP-glucose 4,6-dehydratase
MKIVVTGGLGFIGSNFILQFLKKFPKSQIVNVDAKLKGSNAKNLIEIKNNSNYKFVYGNIANKKLVDSLISKSDIVFNFAAESHVDRSILFPEPFIRSNVIGVFNILEAVRKYKKKLIQISTDEVYGDIRRGSANEEYPLNPSSPYSSTKASAELLVKSYLRTYDIDAIITRCTNNYGPRQDFEKLIPKTIFLAQKNKKIPIYGTGKAIRDWIFVNDHCDAIIRIFHNGKYGESYNISANNELNNISVVKKVLGILGKPKDMISFVKDRPGHDLRYSLDSTKIRRNLKWKPQYKFDQALEYTVKWYLENKNSWSNTL